MIIQHLLVDQYGAFIGKHSERLIVTKGEEKIIQAPLLHLESVIIANQGVSISAEAVRECTERGIPIYFISGTGTAYASLYSAGLIGTVATRRAQFEALKDERGLVLALRFVQGKLNNQATLLKYLAKYRKEAAPELFEALRLAATEINDEVIALEKLERRALEGGRASVEEMREEMMGIEGRAAQKYWRALQQVMPPEVEFPGRVGRGAHDPVNAALNYGYGILYGQVERALVLAGLDVYAGFLHVDRPGKPSLTLDFIEEFRPVAVDRVVVALVNKGVELKREENHLLTKETRRMLADKVFERLETPVPYEGKRHSLRAVIQMQARHVATFLRREREDYLPFQMSW